MQNRIHVCSEKPLGFMRKFDSCAIGTPFLVRGYGLDPDSLIDNTQRFAPTRGGIPLNMMNRNLDLARRFLGRGPIMVHAIGGTCKHPAFKQSRDVINSKAGATGECVAAFPERFDEAFRLEPQGFVNCIREGRKPEITVNDGTRARGNGFAATESLRERRPVYLEP